MSEAKLIILAAGGTGGHLFPAEALARELLARGFKVALVTDRRGQAFGDRLTGVDLHRIRAGRFGAGIVSKLVGAAELGLGTLEARSLLRRLAPACVIGFGGYPSVPTMLAAGRMGLPTLIQEQNAILGRANRLLVSRVRHIATAFAEIGGLSPQHRARAVLTGNPVRPAIAAQRGTPYPALGPDAPFRLLVLGGSQGARILSEIIPHALTRLSPALRARIKIAQQARPEDIEAVRSVYAGNGIDAELATFFDDVPARMAQSHLVISRSGASTVAELAMIGRPAILVPYLHAMDDHQTANARAFAASGGAWVMPQAEFTVEALAAKIEALAASPEDLVRAAAASHTQGRPDAASALADLVSEAAGGANGHTPMQRRAAA